MLSSEWSIISGEKENSKLNKKNIEDLSINLEIKIPNIVPNLKQNKQNSEMKETRKDLKLTNKLTDNRFSDDILRNEQECLNSD